MKKIISVFCFLTLCTLFTSCSGSTPSSEAMTLTNTKTGEKITLNMTRYEISQSVGEEFEDRKCGGIYTYFAGGKSTFYTLNTKYDSEKPITQWKTSEGISLKSSIDDFKKAYPHAVIADNKKAASAYFIYEDNKYIPVTEEEKEKYHASELYIIELSCVSKQAATPDSFSIGQYSVTLTAYSD